MREEEFERASARLFDVPAHMYRRAAEDIAYWLKNSLQRREAEAFRHETQLRFFTGFLRQRRRDFLASSQRSSSMAEIISFIRSLTSVKSKDKPFEES